MCDILDEYMIPVKGYEKLFLVTSCGKIFSLRTNKWLKLQNHDGYLKFASKIGGRAGKNICLFVHRCVAEACLQKDSEDLQVNHKDGNKSNNHISNLEWCTAKENVQHSYDTGLKKAIKGVKHPGWKLSEQDILFISENMSLSSRKLGKLLNVSHSKILGVKKLLNNS